MRLIDADKMALDETESYMAAQNQITDTKLLNANLLVHAKLQKLIADTPTVDAVPVVRCKDCIYYEAGKAYFEYCRNSCGIAYPDGNDFCSYGEYKSNLPAPANREYLSADVRKKDGGNV